MIYNITIGVCTALAWRTAFTVDTGLVRTAFGIGAATLNLAALDVWISDETVQAMTLDSVVDRMAFSIVAARIR